jgi:putative hydrolase
MLTVDFHSHTFMSQCGIHTHLEMLQTAREKGLAGLAITDHGPALRGRHPSSVYERLNQPVEGIRYIKGIEANVTDTEGNIDIPDWLLPMLDIVLLGLHVRFPLRKRAKDWTDALITAMRRNPWVDIITHPVDENFPMNLELLATEARELGMALEVNNSKVLYARTTVSEVERFLAICKDVGCKLAVCSDAHTVEEIGGDDAVRPLLDASGIPDTQIVNATQGKAFGFVAARRAARLAKLRTT